MSVCYQLKQSVGWGTGALKYCQQWRTVKKHVTQKTTPWAQVPAVCEKNNFHLFCSSASGKYNLE